MMVEEDCCHLTTFPALKCIIAHVWLGVKNTPSQTLLLSVVISLVGFGLLGWTKKALESSM